MEMTKKEEKKSEYRVRIEPHSQWGIGYFAEKHKYFLGIGYWKKLGKYGISGQYTVYKWKSDAERLIEEYKNNEIKELEDGVVGYY